EEYRAPIAIVAASCLPGEQRARSPSTAPGKQVQRDTRPGTPRGRVRGTYGRSGCPDRPVLERSGALCGADSRRSGRRGGCRPGDVRAAVGTTRGVATAGLGTRA